MSQNIKARVLRIDPAAQTITAAVDTFQSAREWIGADLLERVGCGSGVDVWVDEEGMLRDGADHWILGGDQMLAGRAVMLGGAHGEWVDLPIPTGVATGAIAWIPARFRRRAQEIADGMRPVAVSWDAEGMAKLDAMNREQTGRVELLAVASIPALLAGEAGEALELGDVVTCPDGRTGFVAAIDGDVITVRVIDGTRTYPRSQLAKVEIID
jgi:hypothetical protein